MSFYGKSFIYDGVSSEIYDLRILDFNPSNPSDGISGGDVSVNDVWLYRREMPYFYGRYYQAPLEFDFTVGSYSKIDGMTRSAIQSWLIGRSQYLPLRIVQDDISDVVFNSIITQSAQKYVGNLNYGLNLHVKCDRPWAIYYPPTITKTYSNSGSPVSETFNYYNASVYSGYNKPTVSFTIDNSSGSTNYFSIINATDSSREFRFDDLTPGETITVDNDKGIITSSASALRMTDFNKNFFRTRQGLNSLTISGNISNFTLSAIFAKGVGA